METLFELWGKRNPEWEKRYQSTIMDVFTDYGKGVNQYQDIRGKIFGAGYEIYIIAFFIGLYYNQTKPLVDDKSKRKVLGQAIMYWGNVENRLGRTSYGKIREYMFAALIARTDVDLIALDKGEITARSVVDALISKMEQYANFGFDYIEEQLENDPNYFFKESAFLRVFTSFLKKKDEDEDIDDEPDSLDDEQETLDNDELREKLKLQEAQENEVWSEHEIDLLKLCYENKFDMDKIAQKVKKSVYAVKFQLYRLGYIKMPLNVTVENTSDHCYIKNIAGDIVYEDEGKLKIINDTIYRFNLKPMCLTVKNIIYSNQKWDKGDKMLVAYTESALFPELSSSSFIDDIEDFVEGEKPEKNKIKVKGKWYDFYGDVISSEKS